VKPAAFSYVRPSSLEEALLHLADPDAKPLAGGQSLIPAMNFRVAQPSRLVDLNGVVALTGISATPDGGLRIGAMTRHRAVETSRLVVERAPLLAEALPFIAHPQIRNRGTMGGSLAHADPAAELPAVVLALEASLELRRGATVRRVPAATFFTGLFATALQPGELLTAVELPPLPAGTGWAFEEMARRHGDYALVGVAATVTLDENRQCAAARVVLFSVGEGPVLAGSVGRALVGRVPSVEAIAGAAAAVQDDIDPPSDIHASATYRRQLARVLTGRALTRALQRAPVR
jgi:CO/xanthine dehydrogenase FAD-binding subunit